MALSSAGRDQIAPDVQAPQTGSGQGGGPAGTPAPGAPVPSLAGGARAGEGAVQRAEVEKQLQSGSYPAAPAAAPAPAGGADAHGNATGSAPSVDIRQVGDKTFVLQAGAWLDTQFDTVTMQAEGVVFGSERYFQLLSQHPEIGPYLALGERVTLVLDGKPYAIGPNGQSNALPTSVPSRPTGLGSDKTGNGTPIAVEPLSPVAEPAVPATPAAGRENEPLALAQAGPAAVGAVPAQAPITLPPCAGGLVMSGLAAALPLWGRRRARHL
jgi:hypothetical protein